MTNPPPYLETDDEESRHLLGSRDMHDVSSERENRRSSRVQTLVLLGVLFLAAVFTVLSQTLRKSILSATSLDKAVDTSYLQSSCPGQAFLQGYSDPRVVKIDVASVAGIGPDGFENNLAGVFSTGQFNQHAVHWIVATIVQSSYGTYFHMVEVEVSSNNNAITVCALQAGDTPMSATQKLDQPTVTWAWNARAPTSISTCDTCPGYGVKDLTMVPLPIANYDPSIGKYEAPGFLPSSCTPGMTAGYANSLSNVTVDLVDGYAGLAFIGGELIDNRAEQAVVYFNTKLGPQINSYILAYVDFPSNQLRMSKVNLWVNDGLVYLCTPESRVLSPNPDITSQDNIVTSWNSGSQMNVAQCQTCAGFGVSSFKFSTVESLPPTPEPSSSPVAQPSAEPTIEPTYAPSFAPSPLAPNAFLAPDGADGVIDGKQALLFWPVAQPTREPITQPTFAPIAGPTYYPVSEPTFMPTLQPTVAQPTNEPIVSPPTYEPTFLPSAEPTFFPVTPPTLYPVNSPTSEPNTAPTLYPTPGPTLSSTIILGRPCDATDDYLDQGGVTSGGAPVDGVMSSNGTILATSSPTLEPTFGPTVIVNLTPGPDFATAEPTLTPTFAPSYEPTFGPTVIVNLDPGPGEVFVTAKPSFSPTYGPTYEPTLEPTAQPSTVNEGEVVSSDGGSSFEPCIDHTPSNLMAEDEVNVYAPVTSSRTQFDVESLKSCENFPGYKTSMRLVASVPRKPSVAAGLSGAKKAIVRAKIAPMKNAPSQKKLTPVQEKYYAQLAAADTVKDKSSMKSLR